LACPNPSQREIIRRLIARYWRQAGIREVPINVRYWGTSGVRKAPLQPLRSSLRACATLPAWETRPISFLVVPILIGSCLFFGLIPSTCAAVVSGRNLPLEALLRRHDECRLALALRQCTLRPTKSYIERLGLMRYNRDYVNLDIKFVCA
jgi:hypothetical protein